MDTVLIWLLVIPAVGALIGALLPEARMAKAWALLVAGATFVFSVVVAMAFFEGKSLTFKPGSDSSLSMPLIGFSLSLGVDSISVWLVLLTTLLSPLAIAASFKSIQLRPKEYYAWMLALLAVMLGVFVARDAILFYVFFELTLVPMFFLIGIWGGPERRAAAGKFFLFTFAGGVFTLAAVIFLGIHAGPQNGPSFDIHDITVYAQHSLSSNARFWVFLGLLAGFAVKVPLFPVHTWLPLAHTEAPTAGSVILAGVLLKLGTYGLLRLAVPIGLIDDGGVAAFPGVVRFIGVLCLIGIIYGALVAWVQQDIKKLVAYSSVSHLGFCVLGMVALNEIGVQGSILYMINHGISTGALFLVIGMIYDRYHTRDIDQLSGLAKIMPKMAFFFVLFSLSSIGLPGTNGFVSEFLTILGAFTSKNLGIGFGVMAALGIILGAVYMLHMLARVVWGPLKVPAVHDDAHGSGHDSHAAADGHDPHAEPARNDITGREIAILVPLAVLVIVLGVMPTKLLDTMKSPVQSLLKPTANPTAVAAQADPVEVAEAK